jgi:hypothetical protein
MQLDQFPVRQFVRHYCAANIKAYPRSGSNIKMLNVFLAHAPSKTPSVQFSWHNDLVLLRIFKGKFGHGKESVFI